MMENQPPAPIDGPVNLLALGALQLNRPLTVESNLTSYIHYQMEVAFAVSQSSLSCMKSCAESSMT